MAVVNEVMNQVRSGRRPLREVLAEHGVPERTYHHWRTRYPAGTADVLETIRTMKRRLAKLTRENERLLREIALQRELLGKPWRR